MELFKIWFKYILEGSWKIFSFGVWGEFFFGLFAWLFLVIEIGRYLIVWILVVMVIVDVFLFFLVIWRYLRLVIIVVGFFWGNFIIELWLVGVFVVFGLLVLGFRLFFFLNRTIELFLEDRGCFFLSFFEKLGFGFFWLDCITEVNVEVEFFILVRFFFVVFLLVFCEMF